MFDSDNTTEFQLAFDFDSHVVSGRTIDCTECGETQGLDCYYKGSGGHYRRRCKSCTKARVVAKRGDNEKYNQYQASHGFTVAACGKWALRNGLGHTPFEPDTITAYKNDNAHKKSSRDQRAARIQRDKLLAEAVRRKAAEEKKIRGEALRQSRIWRFYDAYSRASVGEAWKHWLSIAPVGWFELNGYERPMTDAEEYKHKYNTDPAFALMERTRRRVKKKARGERFNKVDAAIYNALRKDAKGRSLVSLVGYTKQELLDHICSKFTDGMSIDRLPEIHLDHIVPCDMFDMNSIEEVSACWALVNLQPLWASDNIAKSNRIDLESISRELALHLKASAPRVYREIIGNGAHGAYLP